VNLPEESRLPIHPPARTQAQILLALAALCAFAYLPALNNGFIADDFVILDRVTAWKADFSYVFKLSPERFRITSYLAFGLLKWLCGYHAAGYYVFAVLIHFFNAVLVWKFLQLATRSPRIAVWGSALFAVGQSPQEAIMWLAGMNEALAALFILIALHLWLRHKYLWSSVACVAALLSKESWIIVVLLMPLAEFAAEGKFTLRRQQLYLGIPVLSFLLLFAGSLASNALVSHHMYAAGLQAGLVWPISLHRLLFPWAYIAVLLWLATRRGPVAATALAGFAWMAVVLLPYVFLTYQNHVPSRHTYLASIGLAWFLAALVEEMRPRLLPAAFIAAFVVANVAYLWIVKDRQYEQRAAPTTRLIEELRNHSPEPLLVEGFPYNPWVAKTTARLAPGWEPEMIRVNEPASACPACPTLHWDPATEGYRTGGTAAKAKTPVH